MKTSWLVRRTLPTSQCNWQENDSKELEWANELDKRWRWGIFSTWLQKCGRILKYECVLKSKQWKMHCQPPRASMSRNLMSCPAMPTFSKIEFVRFDIANESLCLWRREFDWTPWAERSQSSTNETNSALSAPLPFCVFINKGIWCIPLTLQIQVVLLPVCRVNAEQKHW